MSNTPNYMYLDGQKMVAVDNHDGTKTLAVAVTSGGGGGGSSNSTVTTLYTVLTAFTGASIGDVVSENQVLDLVSGTVTSTIWTNVTTGATLATAPPPASIAQQASNPLTDAQLRATPVAVTVTNNPTDVEFVVQTYKAVAAATGYAIGDLLEQVEAFSTATTTPTYLSTVWRNITQETTLASAPLAANIVPLSVTASAVTVSSSALPTGAATSANQTNKAQFTRLTDGTTDVSVLAGGGGINGLVTSAGPAVFLSSTVNSSTTQLAAGATFTGGIETVFSQPAIQVNLVSDQVVTITINQYIDAAGLKRSGAYAYQIQAGVGFDMCLPMAGNYFNITVTNNGASPTTTFTLDTTYGTMQAVDTYGAQTVSMTQVGYGSANAVYVGGTSQVRVTPTVTAASAYTAGNVVGGVLTFASAVQSTVLSGVLESVTVVVKSNYTGGFKLYLFDSTPGTTFTDKTAPAVTTADASKFLDFVTLSSADQGLGTNNTYYVADNIGKSLKLVGTSLYGVLVAVGTPTFTTTTDVVVTASILKD